VVGGFNETRFDGEAIEFHRKVRKRFLAIAQKEPQRVTVIPADGAANQVEAAIWARVSPLLRSAGFRVE
jgi:dTMP kinase